MEHMSAMLGSFDSKKVEISFSPFFGTTTGRERQYHIGWFRERGESKTPTAYPHTTSLVCWQYHCG